MDKEIIKKLKNVDKLNQKEKDELALEYEYLRVDRFKQKVDVYKALEGSGQQVSIEWLKENILNAEASNIEEMENKIAEILSERRNNKIDSIIDEDN